MIGFIQSHWYLAFVAVVLYFMVRGGIVTVQRTRQRSRDRYADRYEAVTTVRFISIPVYVHRKACL